MYWDTHCHIHEASYPDAEAALVRARAAGVARLLCVGTDVVTSAEAVAFAATRAGCLASVGLHPHDAKTGVEAVATLEQLVIDHPRTVVAVGECGLDYFYNNSPREQQQALLHAQLALALRHGLPVVLHVRQAFADFWPIFDQYAGLTGVVHSFTDTTGQLEAALARGLYIGVNGIATFAREPGVQAMYARVPLERLLLETDAPFLTPVPHRGTMNEPAFVTLVAQHIATLQSINLSELSRVTSLNATHLFKERIPAPASRPLPA